MGCDSSSTTTSTTTTSTRTFSTTTSSTTTLSSTTTTTAMECSGNDSRCAGKNEDQCLKMRKSGVHCYWDPVIAEVDGDCEGNDSRCQGAPRATCERLSAFSDCAWNRKCKSWCATNAIPGGSRRFRQSESPRKLFQFDIECSAVIPFYPYHRSCCSMLAYLTTIETQHVTVGNP